MSWESISSDPGLQAIISLLLLHPVPALQHFHTAHLPLIPPNALPVKIQCPLRENIAPRLRLRQSSPSGIMLSDQVSVIRYQVPEIRGS